MNKAIVSICVLISFVGILCAQYTPVKKEDTQATATITALTTTDIIVSPTAASMTNAQALTVAASAYVITGINGANDTTNAVTLANPTTAGRTVILNVAVASSNLISLADSGNLKLAGAWVGDNNDSITLYAASATVWNEVSRSNN